MEGTNGLFSAKLKELEQEYGQLQSGLHHLEDGREGGQRELDQIWREYEEQLAHLERTARSCRSPAMAQMAALQQEYEQKMERILQERLAGSGGERQAEAAALYAEYAIDFAVQAMRYALMAALTAARLQEKLRTTEAEGENDQYE